MRTNGTTFPKTLAKTATLAFALAVVSAAAAAASVCGDAYNEGDGPLRFFINVHNCGTDCAEQELPYLELYKNGITGVRINPVQRFDAQAPDPRFYELNDDDPYFVGVLDVFGPDKVLVLLDDGVDDGRYAKPSPQNMLHKLEDLLARYPQVRNIELMNEPSNFSGISPEEYVGRYLRPARRVIDGANSWRPPNEHIRLFSAAWFGSGGGVRETQRMVRAGGLAYADAMSAHIYARREDEARQLAREYKRLSRGKPVAVTETNFQDGNASNYEAQFWWVCESMVGMEAIFSQGLPADVANELQVNVFYTLRGDSDRRFNLITFENQRSPLWLVTGPGHLVISERSAVPTDPKGH